MSSSDPTAADERSIRWMLLLVCASSVLAHVIVATSRSYGYFIDEFYYIACARRPAFGYVDHPPLTPLLLAAWRTVAGDSLVAIRVPAFAAGAVVIYLTGQMARMLGGGRWAVLLSAVTVAVAPGFLAVTGFFSVNAFELLFWTLGTWTMVALIRTGNPRLWVALGVFAGLGLENKHTIVTFLIALAAGVIATPARRLLWNRWAVIGAGVAVALALPNVLWQMANGWPSLEFYREAQIRKNLPSPPVQTLVAQLQFMSPLGAPIWLAGLGALLFTRDGRRWMALGIAYLIVLAMLVLSQQSRPDRLAGIYPVLVAAGAVVIERVVRGAVMRSVAVAAIVASGTALSPLVVPVLPPERVASMVVWLGFQTSAERGKTSPIPQLLADRTGWESFVDEVARVRATLPAADRARAVIFAHSYGHAGALELLGPARGIRNHVISNHNTYYHWSAGTDADVLISVGIKPQDLRSLYRDVTQVGLTNCTYCMSWRNNNPVCIARDPIRPLGAVWPRIKHYE